MNWQGRVKEIRPLAEALGETEILGVIDCALKKRTMAQAHSFMADEMFDDENTNDFITDVVRSSLLNAVVERGGSRFMSYGLDVESAKALATLVKQGTNREELLKTLVHGEAEFGPSAVPVLIDLWASLAQQRGTRPAVPTTHSKAEILQYAWDTNDASERAEGSWAPLSKTSLSDDEKSFLVRWDGSWTAGRWIQVIFDFDGDEVVKATFSWNSGTGRPSTLLQIETFLALPECQTFKSLS
jgi:hypothetical protein